jgi:hypothetical protein
MSVDHESPVPELPGWRRPGLSVEAGERAMRAQWDALNDPRSVVSVEEVSALVSTNRVYRLSLSDESNVFIKASTFGSYFLFREDHDRIRRLVKGLSAGGSTSRFGNFLARPLERNDRVITTYDGTVWTVAYEEVERRAQLPKILQNGHIDQLAYEIAHFHLACAAAAEPTAPTGRIPPASTSIKTDIIRLLDLGRDRLAARTLRLNRDQLEVVRRHAHRFLVALDDLGYDDMARVPVLVDWNLGNFSINVTGPQIGDFELFTRWDYDWFRTEPPWLDFYFLSRVSSETGDRTQFTYGMHTLQEPRFKRFLAAYQEVNPMTERDIAFLRETYRFFILHYVIADGDLFFRPDLASKLREDAINIELPMIDRVDLLKTLSAKG